MRTSKRRILYVDDDLDNLSSFKNLYEDHYDVHVASSAEEGHVVLKDYAIDAILSDQGLPGTTGVEFLEQVRNEFPEVVRFIVTASSDPEAMVDAINRVHVYCFFQRPWSETELKATLDAALDAVEHKRERKTLLAEVTKKNEELGLRVAELDETNLALMREIGARKQAERDQASAEKTKHAAERQLAESTKLEAIGRLAGGVAHDLNNVLTAVIGRADLIATGGEQGETEERAREILSSCERASELVQQLLAFSRQQVLELRSLDPNKIIAGLETMLSRLLPGAISLRLNLASVGHVMSDPSQLEQVIMNLVLNASDAMPDGGVIRVETQNIEADIASPDTELSAGNYVMIVISDTGEGIRESVLPHVFEPFYSTKGDGGTGLGLASVYGIVKQSGGQIVVDSTPGRGTAFQVYLPLKQEEPAEIPAAVADSSSGNETILICDDDKMVLAVMELALVGHEYRLLVADSPERALVMAKEAENGVDLLVTDVLMPNQTGPKLATLIREIHPGINTLLVSGYPMEKIAEEQDIDDSFELLVKPFTPTVLLTRVRSILEKSATQKM